MKFLLLCTFIAASSVFASSADPSPSPKADKAVTERLFKGIAKLDGAGDRPDLQLQGEQYWQDESGDTRGFAYYGYKYGKAGRFEEPVANADFGYLTNADRPKLGAACPQSSIQIPGLTFFSRNLTMNEDCLFLDVYVPPVKKDQEKACPVLFFIYGGGFKVGDKDLYNASILARAVDAVVVVANYRVSAFGFLSTGDEAARGNWAIADLKLALNWTLNNIAAFNGDPAKITLFGESAGAALTSALMLDDKVRAQVFAAVAMSGTMVNSWAVRQDPKKGTNLLGQALECPIDTSAGVIACLKNRTVEQILNASHHVLEKAGMVMHYAPVIDGHHIPKAPAQIIRDRGTSPSTGRVGTFISGYLREDSAFFLLLTPHLLNATFNITIVNQLLLGYPIANGAAACPQALPGNLQLIHEFYGITEATSPEDLRQLYYKISTHAMFGVGSIDESKLYSAHPGSTDQLYLISVDSNYRDLGAFHFLDILHLFRGKFDVLLKEKMNDAFTQAMHQFFRQVAYDGRADGPSFGNDGNYLELNEQAKWVPKKQDFAPLLAFWRGLAEKPCPTA
ncbi:putative Neuroligin-4, X-linked [Hypsibius exemplaris]|uniref:Neuroligin-4, X-linked n=1 Tax=Hypsibius exemplaris TaxID=2072580 RepID=A0A1W0WH62_HYPEX|nr:putative Neuroligin-4, X-linked [Hypsibius exemplaris]